MDEPVVAAIIIKLTASGGVKVEGIPDQKFVAYGMIEMAREGIQDYFKQQKPKLITPAPPGLKIS